MTPIAHSRGGAPVSSPAKLVLERRVHLGREHEFEAWVQLLVRSAAAADGHEGSTVLDTGSGEYFVLVRFVSAEALERWRDSDAVMAMLADGDALSTAVDLPIVRSGLETWFAAPGRRAPHIAPRWKMALVTWCALMPQVLLLGIMLPESLPFVLSVALTTAISVSMLTWIVMPRLTGLLAGWLFGPSRTGSPAAQT